MKHSLFTVLKRVHPAEIWLLLFGIAARLITLGLLSQRELDPDAGHYLNEARDFSFGAPWAARYAEPAWVALVKLASAPFGYSPIAYRALTTALSVAVVIVWWVVFQRRLDGWPRRVALGFVSLNALLIFIAPRGTREELVMLLLGLAALSLDRMASGEGNGLALVGVVALLPVVRLELTLILMVVLAIASFRHPRLRLRLGAGVVLAGLLTAPWLISNSHGLGDPFYHSNASATFFRNEDLRDIGRYPGPSLEPDTTWSEYYLDFLGPVESARRWVVGMPSVIAGVFYNSFFPIRPQRFLEIAPSLSGLMLPLRIAAALAASACICFAILGSWRMRRDPAMRWVLLFIFLGLAVYAPLAQHLNVNYRLVAFTVPLLAAPLSVGVEAVKERVRLRAARA